MQVNDLYDPIEQAPRASFDVPGDSYAGVVVKAERVDDKYAAGQIPAITLRLAAPTEDGDDYLMILARSAQLQKELGKAVRRSGKAALSEGDWLQIAYVEEHESATGAHGWKEYSVTHKPTDELDGDDIDEPPAEEIGELDFADPAPF